VCVVQSVGHIKYVGQSFGHIKCVVQSVGHIKCVGQSVGHIKCVVQSLGHIKCVGHSVCYTKCWTCRVCWTKCWTVLHQCSILTFIYMFLPEGQTGDAWEPYKSQRSLRNGKSPDRTVHDYHTTPCNYPEDHRFQNSTFTKSLNSQPRTYIDRFIYIYIYIMKR
jgi:hypothetical protein